MTEIDELSARVGEACRRAGLTVATAESCTGGGVAEAVTRTAGSSAWFDRGFIAYANAAKVDLLGVRQETLGTHGAVSEAVAREMALGALHQSDADLAVAVTGVAGPGGGTATKPVGLVWFAWASLGGTVESRFEIFGGDRAAVRDQAVREALKGLLDLASREG
ncbi:MAG: nicotinamide-nucleotide amidohydrolase family protein [Burkholderiales bacterium]|nr:nicotinamide-nucleotide amidohydrolase family protein [Burkholderiales bacterium]MCL4688543.1 nicotinamide-nucleotide amidohydrolase family protein [Burkholderiales bacterium]